MNIKLKLGIWDNIKKLRRVIKKNSAINMLIYAVFGIYFYKQEVFILMGIAFLFSLINILILTSYFKWEEIENARQRTEQKTIKSKENKDIA